MLIDIQDIYRRIAGYTNMKGSAGKHFLILNLSGTILRESYDGQYSCRSTGVATRDADPATLDELTRGWPVCFLDAGNEEVI